MTTVELVVAASLFAIMTILFVSHTSALQDRAAETALNLEMGESGRTILNMIRREMRQSGRNAANQDMVSQPAAGDIGQTLSFQMREDFGDAWSPVITYRRTPNGAYEGLPGTPPRYALERIEGGEVVSLSSDVGGLLFQRPLGSDTVVIQLVLLRPFKGKLLRRVFQDQVQVQNP